MSSEATDNRKMLQDVFDDAQALDDDDLYDCYTKDEKETLRYDCLVYSKMERKWLARFIPVPGKVPTRHLLKRTTH